MWRHASLSILMASVLAGCWFDGEARVPPPPPAQAAAPAPEPPAPPPPPPETPPLPAEKPAQVATASPPQAPLPAGPPPPGTGPDPKQLVGLDFAQTQHLLGQPAKQEEKPPAKVWTYNGTECDLTIFFYADINTGVFRALTYEFKNHQATEGTDDQCLAHLMQGT